MAGPFSHASTEPWRRRAIAWHEDGGEHTPVAAPERCVDQGNQDDFEPGQGDLPTPKTQPPLVVAAPAHCLKKTSSFRR